MHSVFVLFKKKSGQFYSGNIFSMWLSWKGSLYACFVEAWPFDQRAQKLGKNKDLIGQNERRLCHTIEAMKLLAISETGWECAGAECRRDPWSGTVYVPSDASSTTFRQHTLGYNICIYILTFTTSWMNVFTLSIRSCVSSGLLRKRDNSNAKGLMFVKDETATVVLTLLMR